MTETSAPATPPGGEAPQVARRRRIWPRVLIGVAALLVVALGLGTVYALRIDRTLTSNLNRGVDLPSDHPSAAPGETAAPGEARPTKEPQETGTLNYVLLGSDSRDPDNADGGRSDTIMIVHLNAKRNQAYIISFPRDMYVTIPGYGRNKINAAYAFGGAPLTVLTLEKLTGVRMDHVVLADFESFIELTSDLNGVTVTNKTAFSSHGYNYPVGELTIKGEQALWFVRERKALPRGDLDRAENQRNVIQAIVSKGLSAKVVSDPARFTRFISNVAKHLTVDNSLTDDEIRRTALSLRLEVDEIEGLQAPISGFSTTADGQSIDIVDTAKMAELGTALKTDTMDEYVKKYPQG
jgi:polyisoprenyl-teichoic acid--peptidoglycan teichoic acid transferase